MTLLPFTAEPSRLMRIRYGAHLPGFGHQVTTLCYALKYCLDHDLLPVLDERPGDAYGPWTDYFEPFVDPSLVAPLLARDDPPEIVENRLDWTANREGLFGPGWPEHAAEIKAIFLAVYDIRPDVRRAIDERIAGLGLPAGYSTVHVRRGDKRFQYRRYGWRSDASVVRRVDRELRRRSVGDVFLMTDDYRIVELLRSRSAANVVTLARPEYDGDNRTVRTAPGHLLDLLTEITIATGSVYHLQTVKTRLSKMINLLRDDRGSVHLFDAAETQYASL